MYCTKYFNCNIIQLYTNKWEKNTTVAQQSSRQVNSNARNNTVKFLLPIILSELPILILIKSVGDRQIGDWDFRWNHHGRNDHFRPESTCFSGEHALNQSFSWVSPPHIAFASNDLKFRQIVFFQVWQLWWIFSQEWRMFFLLFFGSQLSLFASKSIWDALWSRNKGSDLHGCILR